MMTTPVNFWEDLFALPEGKAKVVQVRMRLLRKGGRPFMLLPVQPHLAAASLDLYPAQTPRARAARALLRLLLRSSLPLGTERVLLALSPEDPFVRFLSSLAGEPGFSPPPLGILAGNPMTEGQRFLLLVFDAGYRPVAVVKAGLTQCARALVAQEAAFLSAVPANTPAVPRLRSQFESSRLRALALDFFPGRSPRPAEDSAIPALLASWLNPDRSILVSEAADWKALREAAPAEGIFSVLTRQLNRRTVHPAIHHGDFAPWNIRVAPNGTWTVLDWERAQLAGIPGWDWFHYVIQSGILVGRLSTPALVQRVEGLLELEAFQQYAARSGIRGSARELLQAYLLHVVEVIKPSEGAAAAADLLQALSTRWKA